MVLPPGKDISQNVQTVYDSTTSDESDVEWEDVDVAHPAQGLFGTASAIEGRDETLQITLDREPEARKRAPPRRKPVTAAEKKLRLDAHKAHLLCLLAHVNLRNRWCNDDVTQVRPSLLDMDLASNEQAALSQKDATQKDHCFVEPRRG
jgi:xeroderma pigmentosum group C-complementing protein